MPFIVLAIFITAIAIGISKYTATLRNKTKTHRIVVFLFIFLAISGDDGAALLSYAGACMDTGIHIKNRIPAAGFYAPTVDELTARRYLKKGYSFVESGEAPTSFKRYTLEGSFTTNSLISVYEVKSSNYKWGYKTRIYKTKITNLEKSIVIGYEATASTNGGIILQTIQRIIFLDKSALSCIGSNSINGASGDLITAAIPPSK